MKSHKEDFADLLIRYRGHAGLTQQDLARKIGVHRNTIGNWEDRASWPGSRGQVLRLADELNIDTQEERKAFLLAAKFSLEQWSTLVWTVPLQRDKFFTGRDTVLESLHRQLVPGNDIQAISGLGGVGKTHTASEYAHRFSQYYEAVLWLQADSWELLISECLKLAAELGLKEQKTAEDVVVEVKRWLQKHHNWLLILDNVENPQEILSRFIPTRHQGSVLITTRVQDAEPLASTQHLSTLSKQEGTLFLLRRMRAIAVQAELEQAHEEQCEGAQQIWQLMDGLPLAIDQAGAYILETGCSFRMYQDQYSCRHAELLQRRGKRFVGHEMSVAATFSLALESVEKIAPVAADILRTCSLLQGEAIPEELFLEGAVHVGKHLAANTDGWDEAVGILRDYSLVQRNTEKRTLTIHRLVQTVLMDTMEPVVQYQWAERVVRTIGAMFPSDPESVDTWPLCLRYLEQAQACYALIKQHKFRFIEAVTLLNRTGTYLRLQALYTTAEVLYQHALAINEQQFGSENVGIAPILNNLGLLYYNQGKYGQAESFYLRAIVIYGNICLVDAPEVATVCDNLAAVYEKQGNYVEAEPLCEYAMYIRWKWLGPTHRATVCSMNNLAAIYQRQGKSEQAEKLYQDSLTLCEKHLSSQPLDLANSLNNLAELYHEQGKYEQAELLYQRALQIQEQYLELDHPDIAYLLSNLANVHYQQGKHVKAERLFQRALLIWEQRLGLEHLNTIVPLSGLSALYKAEGKDEQAKLFFQREQHIRKQVLHTPHFDRGKTLHDLAILQETQDHYDQALILYQQALVIRSQTLGPTHPSTIDTHERLCFLLRSLGQAEEAKALEERQATCTNAPNRCRQKPQSSAGESLK